MNCPESKPWRCPIRVPSDTRASAREASDSAAKRQARGELRGSSARSASKRKAAASSADIEPGLDELAQAVELVRVEGGAVRLEHDLREARSRAVVVGGDERDRRRI